MDCFQPAHLTHRRANPSPCNSTTRGRSKKSDPDLTQTGIRSKKHPLDRAAALPSILIAPCALSVHTIPEFRSNGYLTHPTNFSGVLHQKCQVVIAFPHCRVFFSFCLGMSFYPIAFETPFRRSQELQKGVKYAPAGFSILPCRGFPFPHSFSITPTFFVGYPTQDVLYWFRFFYCTSHI